MNSPSDDDMFSRYRTELVMDAEARARTFRKLQERVLRGEQPVPETDVLPPQTAALRGLWSLPAKWVVTIAGLGVGALLVANVGLPGTPLTAAEEARVLVAPRSQPAAELVQAQRSHDSNELVGTVREPETHTGARAQAKSAARAPSPRANQELAKRTANVAPAAGPQPSAAARAQPPLPGGMTEVVPQSSAAQSVPPAYASPKVPQRTDKEIASETLTKEVQLLQAAQLALRAGDTQRSLALLAEHTWTYPQGHLAEARDVARILALCQAGNTAQSKLHAKRFLQQRPESPYALRVRAGCAAMAETQDPRRDVLR